MDVPLFLLAAFPQASAVQAVNGRKELMAAALRGDCLPFLQSHVFIFVMAGLLVLRTAK